MGCFHNTETTDTDPESFIKTLLIGLENEGDILELDT